MADVNANIHIGIDSSDALGQLKSLQRQISQFHASIAKSSEAAAVAQRSLQTNLVNSINSIGTFSAEMRTIKTTAESFTTSLEKNKFSMREYFRYATASTKTFGRVFQSEFDAIGKVAEDRVKKLQTQYIKMGRDATGAMKAIAVIPNELNMNDFATKTQLAAQKQAIFNQLVKQGSTNLLNFGKNTQWAGRQLMVGFTIPLITLGSVASKTFMEMETAALKFKKVYGDIFTTPEETQQALDSIKELANSFTQYGVAAKDTVALAADAAAAGFKGLDLQRQTAQATRLSVLGQIDQQKALETTIALQNAFRLSSEDLGSSIDFLNAVENQTVTSLDDITTAIPKAAPVVQQLGGDVKDLAFFLTAMKEGGINASEGANALKSGLAAMINPTGKAVTMLSQFNINIRDIVERNRGDLKATVIEFANALNKLDPLNRAQAIEQLFGKFQFARISTLFSNITQEGTQARKVLDLAGYSIEDLAGLSQKELGQTAASPMNKFRKAVEDLKVALQPLGQTFLEVVTPIAEFAKDLLDRFNNLSPGVKKALTVITVAVAAIGPVALMTFGLLANGLANIIKLGMTLRNGWLKLTGQSKILGEQTQYLTSEQLDAAAAAASLDQAHQRLTQRFTVEVGAVNALRDAYMQAIAASQRFAATNPGMMLPGAMRRFASGGIIRGAGTGTSDSIIARVSNGEAIIPAKSVAKNPDVVNALVSGNIPGFAEGIGAESQSKTVRVGSRLFDLSGMNSKTIMAVVSRVSEATAKQVAGELSSVALQQLADTIQIFASDVTNKVDVLDSAIRQIPELKFLAKEVSSKYNAKAAGEYRTVERQLKEDRPATGAREYERAQMITSAAATAMEEAGVSAGRVSDAAQIVRGHIVTFSDNELKIASKLSFSTDTWEAISQAENQLSNILADGAEEGPRIQHLYLEELNLLNAEKAAKIDKLKLEQKIKNNMALTEDEYQVQSIILQNMLRKSSENAEYAKQITGAFSDYAIGTIAAADVRAISPMANAGRTQEELTRGRGQALLEAVRRGRQSVLSSEEAQFLVDNFAQEFADAIAQAGQMASPSREIHRRGDETYQGFEDAIISHIDDAKSVGQKLGSAAIAGMQETQSGSAFPTRRPGAIRPTGAPGTQPTLATNIVSQNAKMLPIVSSAALDKEAIRKTQQETDRLRKEMEKTRRSFTRFSPNLMSASMGLSALTGVLSMTTQDTNSAFAKLTDAAFKASMALSGISMLQNIFPGLGFKGIAGRFKMAKQAVTATSYGAQAFEMGGTAFKTARGAAMATRVASMGAGSSSSIIARFGPLIGRAALGISKFLGPVGLATTAITGLYMGFKWYQKTQEEARQRIQGLGNAALISSEKLKTLDSLLGTVSTGPNAFERAKAAGGGQETVASGQQRTQIQQLRSSQEFKDTFKNDIEALKNASDQQAMITFKNIAVQLKGKGYSRQAIEAVIKALQEESGKTKLNLNFKTIALFKGKGLGGIKRSAQQLADTFSKDFAKGVKEGSRLIRKYDPMTQTVTYIKRSTTRMSDDFKKTIDTTAKNFQGFFFGLNQQFENGMISTKEFNSGFTALSSTIKNMKKPEALTLLNRLMKKMLPEEFVKSAQAIHNVDYQLMLLKGSTAGISPDAKVIEAMQVLSDKANHSVPEIIAATTALYEYNAAIAGKMKGTAGANKPTPDPFKPPPGTTDGTKENPWDFLQETLKQLQNTRNAAIFTTNIMKSLKAILAGKTKVDIFGGLESQFKKAKVSSEFSEMLLGLDEKTFNKIKQKLFVIKNGVIKKLTPLGQAANKAVLEAQIGLAKIDLAKRNKEFSNTAKAFDLLRKAGYGVADAGKVAGESLYAAALASGAIKLGTKEWKQFKATIDAYLKNVKRSEFQNVLDSIAGDTSAINDKIAAYKKLVTAGYDIIDAASFAESSYASQIAQTKVGTAAWKKLTTEINLNTKAQENNSVYSIGQSINAEIKGISDRVSTYNKLRQAGLSVADAAEIASDQLKAAAIAAGLIKPGSEEWKKFISILDIKKLEDFSNKIGELQAAIEELKSPADAFNKFKSLGADVATAYKLASNSSYVILMNAAKTKEQMEQIYQVVKEYEAASALKTASDKIIGDTTNILNTARAYKTLTDAKFSSIAATRLAKDADIAQAIAMLKGTDALNKFLDGLREYEKLSGQTEIDAYQGEIDSLQKELALLEKLHEADQQRTEDAKQALQDQIELLEKQKEPIEAKIEALRLQNDEYQRQEDFLMKQAELTKSQVEAKIRGDYLGAALIGQQKLFNQAGYNRDTDIKKLEAQSRVVDSQIKVLQDRVSELDKAQSIRDKAFEASRKAIETKIKANEEKIQNIQDMLVTALDEMTQNSLEALVTSLNENVKNIANKAAADAAAAKASADAALLQATAAAASAASALALLSSQSAWDSSAAISAAQVRLADQYFSNPTPNTWSFNPDATVPKFATGGFVRYAGGGRIVGPGTGTSDSIPAIAGNFSGAQNGLTGFTRAIAVSNNEYVMRAAAVKQYGIGTMDAINQGKFNAKRNSTKVYNDNSQYSIDVSGVSDPQKAADIVMQRLATVQAKNNGTNKMLPGGRR